MTIINPAINLRSRAIRAGSWTLGGNVASQLVRLASNLVMTRLLAPEMFGIVAVANVIIIGLQLLTDVGLSQNVVQNKHGNEPRFLNTVWTMQIVRGGLIWGLCIVIGIGVGLLGKFNLLPAESVYADPDLPLIIYVLSFSALISGFVSTNMALASRELRLGHLTLIELGSQVAALALMVIWASFDPSIWALVSGFIFSALIRVALSHAILYGERNRLEWNRAVFDEVFAFGKWIFLSSLLGFLAANLDRLILAAFLSPTTFGIYTTAFFIVSAVREVFLQIGSRIALPVFGEVVRDRPNDLKRTYYKLRLPLDVLALLVAGILMSSGHMLIQLLYDPRYLAAGHMTEILCISLIEVRFVFTEQCIMALGHPKLLVPLRLIRLLALAVLLPTAYFYFGLDAALWVVGAHMLLALPLMLYLKRQLGILDLARELYVLPVLLFGYFTGVVADWIVSV